jgi:acyl-CoA hydrolase
MSGVSGSVVQMSSVTERTIESSADVHLDEWIAPELVDDNGLLRVGRILEWMDVGGALAATRYCRRSCMTASVNGVDLLRPLEVGEHVSMTARVCFTTQRSLGVHVSMRARGAKLFGDTDVLLAYMTFVPARDADGTGGAGEVRHFEPITPRDRALHREGELRREFRQKLATGDFSEHERDSSTGMPALRERISLRTLARDFRRRITPFSPEAGRPSRPSTRSPECSYVHRIEPVLSGAVNVHGTLYGGTLMRWIENAASLSARAFSESAMVVHGVHGLDFLRPVNPHVFLHTHAMAVRADAASVTIRVEVTSEDPLTGASEQCLSGYFTYRTLDPKAEVPELSLSSATEHVLCAEATHHLALARRLREQ